MASRVVEESDQQQQQQQHLSMSMLFITLVGFRFTPTDIELIECYLDKKISSPCSLLPEADGLIVDFDIYSCNPWELPRHRFRYPSQQREMYFFTATRPPNSNGRSSNSSTSKRCGRTAGCGVWHGNGQDHRIVKNGVVIGHTTAFKFEMIAPAAVDAGAEKERGSNKRSNGNGSGRRKTDWLMHEYRLTSTHALVLCKIYENKSREAVASCRKQEEDQDQEEVEPISVRSLSAAMPSWTVSTGCSDAPDHIIQVPKKRRRVEMEEEPAIIPQHAAMPASSSEITFMASAPLPLPTQQQQQQQDADFADSLEQQLSEQESDFADSLEQQLLEQDADQLLKQDADQLLEQDADQLLKQDADQLLEQDADFVDSLEQQLLEQYANQLLEQDVDFEDSLDQQLLEQYANQLLEQDADSADSLKQQLLEQVPARSMPDEAAFLSSLQNMPELPSLPSLEEQQKGNVDSLLSQISFDDEPGSLPPLDFTIPEDVLSMTADEFLSGVEDYPF